MVCLIKWGLGGVSEKVSKSQPLILELFLGGAVRESDNFLRFERDFLIRRPFKKLKKKSKPKLRSW